MKFPVLHIVLLLLHILLFSQIYAQDEGYSREKDKTGKLKEEKDSKSPQGELASKFVFGGGLGLQFGSYTYIEVTPKVGYKYIPKGLAGLGVIYRYYRYEDDITHAVYTGSDYGGNIFTSYELFRNLIGWGEFELLNYAYYDYQTHNDTRLWVGSPFLGLGYRQQIGQKGFVQLAFLYNLYYTTNSPYGSPLVTRINIFL